MNKEPCGEKYRSVHLQRVHRFQLARQIQALLNPNFQWTLECSTFANLPDFASSVILWFEFEEKLKKKNATYLQASK